MYSLSGGHTQYPGMDEPQVTIPWGLPRCVNPAGGMISNVEDMLKWFQFHLGGGSDLLSAKTLAEMKETQTTISALPGNETDWGIGWQLGRAGGLRTFAHGGGTLGQISHSFGIPERNFAISSMTNSLRGGKVIEAIEEWVLQHELGITSQKPQPVTLSLDQLERLTGTYKVTLTTSTVELIDGTLTMRTIMRHPLTNEEMELPPVQLVPVSEWEVQTMEDGEPGGVGQFIPGPDGRASHVRMGRLAARVE